MPERREIPTELPLEARDLIHVALYDEKIARALVSDPSRFQPLLGRPIPKPEPLDINDALRAASTNEKFASALISNPEKFKETFRLSDDQITGIKDIAKRVPNPGDLATDISYE